MEIVEVRLREAPIKVASPVFLVSCYASVLADGDLLRLYTRLVELLVGNLKPCASHISSVI